MRHHNRRGFALMSIHVGVIPRRALAILLAGVLIGGCEKKSAPPPTEAAAPVAPPAATAPATTPVDQQRLLAADGETANWLMHGRTYDEQRFSPLTQLDRSNVAGLKLAWFLDLDTQRGQEATPLVIDGTMYVSTAWSKVKAIDAASGRIVWEYDPQVPGSQAVRACCDVVNRGVAAWGDKLYFGTLDGRLIALDRASGRPAWSVDTIDRARDGAHSYTITGAPRIVKGKVIIGNGGAEFGVRGYVSAYDAETGALAWRFFTVPGNPADGFENDAMAMAAKTWNGEWWKLGGGGTVWDSMAYDPETDLLYIGTGNGSPWNQSIRSPGGGDNLFLSSIVALHVDDGTYAWHFQETPGETWDYTANQHIVIATLTLDGKPRKVLLHAPKNGFFYVIDALTGQFISARNYVTVTWASGIDANGRPIENPEARFERTGKPTVIVPGPGGAHSWHPMSYSPQTGLVYIPANIAGFPYIADASFVPAAKGFNTGTDFGAAAMPQDPAIKAGILSTVAGRLVAWDPVAQKEAWGVAYDGAANGGVLSTAGGLVFQGSKAGQFAAFDAANGARLWSAEAQTGVIAAPVTYTVGGKQFVAVLAGSGGVESLAPGEVGAKGGGLPNRSRVLAFALDGTASLPALPPTVARELNPLGLGAKAELVETGKAKFGRFCAACHGDAVHSAGLVPDLRYSAMLAPEAFTSVVRGGALESRGMVSFADVISEEDTEAIRNYVIARAVEDRERAAPAP
jgi:quinohemoprotein ethanol dehydrogenase